MRMTAALPLSLVRPEFLVASAAERSDPRCRGKSAAASLPGRVSRPRALPAPVATAASVSTRFAVARPHAAMHNEGAFQASSPKTFRPVVLRSAFLLSGTYGCPKRTAVRNVRRAAADDRNTPVERYPSGLHIDQDGRRPCRLPAVRPPVTCRSPCKWSGRQDSNLRPPHPQCDALPGCATPRPRNRTAPAVDPGGRL